MKFIHISDLHIGKRINEYSLTEEQRDILNKIIDIVKDEKPDGILIAGDIYDKSIPGAEAVTLLDEFLEKIVESGTKAFIISGNHDSAERVAYGASAFEKEGIYLSPVFGGEVKKYSLEDGYGRVNVYLLPFVKPAHVKKYFDEEIETCTDAVDAVLKRCDIDEGERNVIVAHQFVTGGKRRDSEDVNVGGLENVEGWVFDKFDYAALGHLHKNQAVGRETVRYSGTGLKYSASEANDEKCVVAVEMKEKGNVKIREIPLSPMRDYLDIKGKLDDILKSENKNDFVRITLTDDETLIDAYGKLKMNYPFMTELVFDRKRKEDVKEKHYDPDKSEEEKFKDFYEEINGRGLTDEQINIVEEIIAEIKEEEE